MYQVLLSWGGSAHWADESKTLCGRPTYSSVSRDQGTCAEVRQCQRCAGLKAQREFKAAESRRVMEGIADRATEETGILHAVSDDGGRIVQVDRIVLRIQRRETSVPLTELFQCPDHGVTKGCCDRIMALGAYRPDERVCCAMCEEPLADERHPDGLKMGATGILGPQCAWCAAHGHPTDSDCDSDCPARVRQEAGRALFDSIKCPSCQGAPRYPARGCIDAFHDNAPETALVPMHVPSPVGWPVETTHRGLGAVQRRIDGPLRFRAARGKHKRSAHRRGW